MSTGKLEWGIFFFLVIYLWTFFHNDDGGEAEAEAGASIAHCGEHELSGCGEIMDKKCFHIFSDSYEHILMIMMMMMNS